MSNDVKTSLPQPKRELCYEKIRVFARPTIGEEEAKELLDKWDEMWPEVLDFIRKKAAEIDHQISIENGKTVL